LVLARRAPVTDGQGHDKRGPVNAIWRQIRGFPGKVNPSSGRLSRPRGVAFGGRDLRGAQRGAGGVGPRPCGLRLFGGMGGKGGAARSGGLGQRGPECLGERRAARCASRMAVPVCTGAIASR